MQIGASRNELNQLGHQQSMKNLANQYMSVIETGLKDNKLTKYNSKTDLWKRSPLIRKKDSPLRHVNIVSGMPKPYE